MVVDEKDNGNGICTWIFQIWPVACSHKNRALPILSSDSQWVLIGAGGDDTLPATREMQWMLPHRSSPCFAADRRAASSARCRRFGWFRSSICLSSWGRSNGSHGCRRWVLQW
ncbi:hypothetical protein ACLOJK_008310 [Asimina triloba]